MVMIKRKNGEQIVYDEDSDNTPKFEIRIKKKMENMETESNLNQDI